MKSMTGFGFHRSTTPESTIEVSVRTVNARFLEPRFHLPRECLTLEGELREILSATIRRGTVDIFVSKKSRRFPKAKVRFDAHLAREVHGAFGQVAKALKMAPTTTLETVLRWPNVITVEETDDAPASDGKAVIGSFKKALAKCVSERQREGRALRTDMQKHLVHLEKCLKKIQELRAEANEMLQIRMESRLRERLPGLGLEPARIAQEVALWVDRADINEEIERLREHLRLYRQWSRSPYVEGKKLDFYTQELLREFNTIGSKSQFAALTQVVVEAKTTVERLREQVQNVE